MIWILVTAFLVWMIWEVWRAPMVKEGPDDSITWIGPTKRLRDLFKK